LRFTGFKREPDRQAVGIYRMNLAGQTAVIGPWIVFCSE
jgi:hypothetical protein